MVVYSRKITSWSKYKCVTRGEKGEVHMRNLHSPVLVARFDACFTAYREDPLTLFAKLRISLAVNPLVAL